MSDTAPAPTVPDELHASLLFAGFTELLPTVLSAQLEKHAGVSLFDYFVLINLEEAPEHTLRLKALAACTNATMPRMSRVAARLEEVGLVARTTLTGSGRAITVTLTAPGKALVSRATPAYLGVMRETVFDNLTGEQARQLIEICTTLLLQLRPDMEEPIRRHIDL